MASGVAGGEQCPLAARQQRSHGLLEPGPCNWIRSKDRVLLCRRSRDIGITLIEVLGWRGHSAQSRTDAQRLLGGLTLIGLTQSVVERTIVLRSRLSIALPDAVIAPSALVEGLCLVTRNVQDFDRVDGLVLENPFALG